MTIAPATPALDAAALRDRLEAAWSRSDRIFDLLAPEALYQRPIALRQPFIFYVGHLPAFGWNQVARGLLGRAGFQPAFDDLFARGIDPVGVDTYEPDRADLWPAPADVLAYRDRVRETLRGAFADVAARAAGDVLAEHGRVWHLVIEHELMHHETLLYMVHQLDRRFRRRPADLPAHRTTGAAPPARVRVSAGDVTLGADFAAVPFGWDNEFPATVQHVGDFTVDTTPVRNGEWLDFMADGGYTRPELWTPDGWAWKERVGHAHPAFWTRHGGAWVYEALFDQLPLDDVREWPVYVSWAEADAFARWRGADLPTEAEFHRAAEGVPWGEAAHGNFDFTHWAPMPVGAYAGGASRWGALDLVGNGWEWTRSRFAPFPGFQAWARTYPGYSADFFDEHHHVMLGASWATDRALVRRSFRNWFQPHYPFVFAKFRCVVRS
jgi:ergothioneine biosynthesis protein EgtB